MTAVARSAFAAAALVAFAGSAHAAERHTWWYVRYDKATCALSPITPERYVNYENSPEGHATGWSAQPITLDDVAKNPATGDISVHVSVTHDGVSSVVLFFTNKDVCESTIKDMGIKPYQPPHDDIN
jgi:hypothetical protein